MEGGVEGGFVGGVEGGVDGGVEGGVEGGVVGDVVEGSEEEGDAAVATSCAAPPQPVIASANAARRNQKSVFIVERQVLHRRQTGIWCNAGGHC